ncbi:MULTISPECIES: hypothetical protein [Streptomyces]|uniref:Uncharacterized protein n=1 Tax=Streptomyces alboflavus TaxID=67267 RepID=A0A1Z1WCP0_9ACTN|nr:hypothetical protein [Streptomyces alboflavus]ARX84138.1 hypothetical protein SMD44_03574 [Streptomyces alboflavus]
MFQGASIVQQTGVVLLAALTAIWAVTFLHVQRRRAAEPATGNSPSLGSLPVQSGPPRAESVELTPDERAAFAGLIRQFGRGRS